MERKGVLCPACGSVADGGHQVGQATVFICPQCGGYRLSGTLLTLIENGTVQLPDPDLFRQIVARKRGAADEYPTITSYDLQWEWIGLGPFKEQPDGEPSHYATPLVRCPLGHERRLSETEVGDAAWRCSECGCSYGAPDDESHE